MIDEIPIADLDPRQVKQLESAEKVLQSNPTHTLEIYGAILAQQPGCLELRKKLREKGILFKITKNKITKLAVKETSLKELEKFFEGPTAAALSSDPITTAKILTNFAKSHEKYPVTFFSGVQFGMFPYAECFGKNPYGGVSP